MIIYSNGFGQDYFQISRSDDQFIRRGPPLEDGYIGIGDINNYADNYGYTATGDIIDYSDRSYMFASNNEGDYANTREKESYQYDSFRDEWADCDKEIQLSNGTRYYWVYQDLNSSRCQCQYSDYKDPDLMFTYYCAMVSSGGKGQGKILTVPDPWSMFSCKMSFYIQGKGKDSLNYSDQVFLYRQ